MKQNESKEILTNEYAAFLYFGHRKSNTPEAEKSKENEQKQKQKQSESESPAPLVNTSQETIAKQFCTMITQVSAQQKGPSGFNTPQIKK